MFEANVKDGILGNFEINENGDPAKAAAPWSASRSTRRPDKLETEKTLSPKPEDVEAARRQLIDPTQRPGEGVARPRTL